MYEKLISKDFEKIISSTYFWSNKKWNICTVYFFGMSLVVFCKKKLSYLLNRSKFQPENLVQIEELIKYVNHWHSGSCLQKWRQDSCDVITEAPSTNPSLQEPSIQHCWPWVEENISKSKIMKKYNVIFNFLFYRSHFMFLFWPSNMQSQSRFSYLQCCWHCFNYLNFVWQLKSILEKANWRDQKSIAEHLI